MTQNELALQLADCAEPNAQTDLIEQNAQIADQLLALCLKDICLESWTSNPSRSVRAASALKILSEQNNDSEISAFSAWTQGLAAMIGGEMKRAVEHFDFAEKQFLRIGGKVSAAETQVAKLYPMAMLGQYAGAIEIGLQAREVFLEAEDLSAVGRIEHNLGNIYQRTDDFTRAEQFLRLARERFVALENYKSLAQITNSLAYLLSRQYLHREAEKFYREALHNAVQAEMFVTKAEIESSLGHFSLAYGQYDRALKYLERARAGYIKLEMPHESAIAEQEMADAYTELNLFAEASVIYEKIIPLFAEFEMPLERARALLNFGRVCFAEKKYRKAEKLLTEAQAIFVRCGSQIGEANALLNKARILQVDGKLNEAVEVLKNAKYSLKQAGIIGTNLLANVFHSEVLIKLGENGAAETELRKTLTEAENNFLPQISILCLTALGKLAKINKDLAAAENHFQKAIEIIEVLRAPLPAEDFRGAFFADKLAPYNELIQLFLTNEKRAFEAFEILEKSRSRVLLETIQNGRTAGEKKKQSGEIELLRENLAELREDLNWLYNELNSPTTSPRTFSDIEKLQNETMKREATVAETMRRINLLTANSKAAKFVRFDLPELQKHLGAENILLEFSEFEGGFSLFVVSGNKLETFPQLFSRDELHRLLAKFQFQIAALRSAPEKLNFFLDDLSQKTRRVLAEIYDLILRPIEKQIGTRRLIISADGILNYVPFHALFDGFSYLIETREVIYTPSAAILQNCLTKPRRQIEKPLLIGFADERIPLVDGEIHALKEMFQTADVFLGGGAASNVLRGKEFRYDALHLACHGQFRADNPLFSSLRLADGWLNVRDLSGLNLDCELAVLSACETGVSEISSGNEMLGLARGFFSAGVNSLIVSLWNVHDETTVEFMKIFYVHVRGGLTPAASLRQTQIQLLQSVSHPFFWSPFFLIGRW